MAVWEVARITVAEATEDEFESIVRSHIPLLRATDGCLDVKLLRAVDAERTFVLLLQWESVDHHLEFTKTEEFAGFVGALGPLFTGTPDTFHAATVIEGF
ncbi:putative quinol monooxygenase [Streptomyces sp. NPDC057428]|uniref:putative quinol monooxygenase n=1 Tax=Streptomyces sp. NPDC057428 TaxID=3346129 RepID=UPI0036BEC50F